MLAGKFFKMCVDYDPEKIYFYVNFIARQIKDEAIAKQILEASKLAEKVTAFLETEEKEKLILTAEEKSEEEQAVFSLALAYHQIHAVSEAEELYRAHMRITDKHSLYTISNLAELLAHARGCFDEAEALYKEGLELVGGYNDVHIKISATIELALVGLHLAQNQIQGGLSQLANLLQSSHIKCSRNTLTEGWIIYYIHCPVEEKIHALTMVKQQLVTQEVRPKLILMFDANIAWAKQHHLPDAEWIELLCQVYNCEQPIEVLDQWEDWAQIEVSPPPPDIEATHNILASLFEGEEEDQMEQDNVQPAAPGQAQPVG